MKRVMIGFLCLLLFACKSTLGTGSFLGTSSFKGYTELSSAKVKGRSCEFWLLHILPIGDFTFNGAFNDALEKSPKGTDSFASATMSIEKPIPILGFFMIVPIVAPFQCVILEGFPARTTPSSAPQ